MNISRVHRRLVSKENIEQMKMPTDCKASPLGFSEILATRLLPVIQ